MTTKIKADWEAVERDYRAGILTFAEMADKHKITKGRISQVAKKNDWGRDLSARIKSRAEEKLNNTRVNKKLNAKQKASDAEIIEAGAEVVFRIKERHQTSIPQKSALVAKLFAEIEGMTDGAELFETLQEALASDDATALATAVKKVTSLPQRIKGTTDLVSAYKTLIALERQAFGIDETGGGEGGIDDLLKQIYQRNRPLVDDD